MKNKEFAEVITAWQRDNAIRNLAKDSIETYGASARDLCAFFFPRGIQKVKQIDDEAVREYIYAQMKHGLGTRTINTRLKALRRILRFYRERFEKRYVPPRISLLREDRAARNPLTDLEVCRLIRRFSPKDPDSVLVAFLLDTGIRSRSVRNVTVEDLDLEAGFVTIRVTKNRDELILPLSAKLAKLLEEYLRTANIDSGYVFRNAKGGPLYDRSSVFKRVNRYMKRSGVKKTGVHLFRYTFGKIMVENNCNAMLLQQWFGHRTMDETRRYVRLYSSELKDACEYVTPLSAFGKIQKKLSLST